MVSHIIRAGGDARWAGKGEILTIKVVMEAEYIIAEKKQKSTGNIGNWRILYLIYVF